MDASVELVKCHGEVGCCGLVQLRHSVDPTVMYAEAYGYRSGLNSSMLKHLEGLLSYALDIVELGPGDLAVDIGSNDGSLLNMLAAKPLDAVTLLGVAGCTYIMGVPGADDVMLNYQSTSFHDSHYLRQALGLRPAPEFEAWLRQMGVVDRRNRLREIGRAHALLAAVARSN